MISREYMERLGLTEDQRSRYELLLETRGNKAYLVEGDSYSNPDPGDYQVIETTTEKYVQAYEMITGRKFEF